ncbi:hypothetical protein MRX96_013468 [Rhipicephalus microplus]
MHRRGQQLETKFSPTAFLGAHGAWLVEKAKRDPGPGFKNSATPAVFRTAMHSTFRLIGLRDLGTLHTSLRDAQFELQTDHCIIWLHKVRGHIAGSQQTWVTKSFDATVLLETARQERSRLNW